MSFELTLGNTGDLSGARFSLTFSEEISTASDFSSLHFRRSDEWAEKKTY